MKRLTTEQMAKQVCVARMHYLITFLLLILLGLAGQFTYAQPYPESLGQPIVYDNRPGANGVIAYGLAAKASADGYTLVVLSTPFPLNAALGRTLSYDTVKDFTPIALIANFPNLLFVHPSVPAHSLREFVAYAKSKMGTMTYASSGSGSVQHLAMELFRRRAGFDAVHVPYAGSAPAMVALIGGHVDAGITNLPAATPHLRANRLRVIGAVTANRAIQLPQVPTFVESGFDVTAPSWIGVAAPRGISREIVDRLNVEITRIINLPDVREKFASLGAEPRSSTPQEFSAFIRHELERWTPLIKQSGASADQ